jgi:hypothetical protein
MAITVSILQRKLSYGTKCRSSATITFSLCSIIETSEGEVHDLSGEVEKFSGEVQNDLRGGAHLTTPPSKSGLDANKSPQLERAY